MPRSDRTHPYDGSTRGTAIFVGLMFLTATVSFAVGDALVQGARAPGVGPPDSGRLALGVALQGVCAVTVAAIGVGLLRVLGRYERGLAYGHFAVRILEGVVILVIGAYMLTSKSLVDYEPVIYLFTGTAGLLFTTALLRTRLIPTWLGRLGVVGYIAILLVMPAGLLGIASLDTVPGMLLYVPGGLFELLLPILLIARGFRRRDTAAVPIAHQPEPAFTNA